jgi:chitinase
MLAQTKQPTRVILSHYLVRKASTLKILLCPFSWAQISETPTVTLIGADTETPSFVVETVTLIGLTHTFQLTVTDSAGSTSTDTIDVDIIANEAPTANAGADQIASDGDTVTLSGTESADPEGLALSFSWEKISASPAVTLTGADTATPSFVVEAGLFAWGHSPV